MCGKLFSRYFQEACKAIEPSVMDSVRPAADVAILLFPNEHELALMEDRVNVMCPIGVSTLALTSGIAVAAIALRARARVCVCVCVWCVCVQIYDLRFTTHSLLFRAVARERFLSPLPCPLHN